MLTEEKLLLKFTMHQVFFSFLFLSIFLLGGNSQWSIGWGGDEPQPNNNFQKGYKDQVQTY
jgi:hypothetical protein